MHQETLVHEKGRGSVDTKGLRESESHRYNGQQRKPLPVTCTHKLVSTEVALGSRTP